MSMTPETPGDQGQPPLSPESPGYPGFQTTSVGLARLHQLVGKLLHEALERELALAESVRASEQGRALLADVQARYAPPSGGGGGADGAD